MLTYRYHLLQDRKSRVAAALHSRPQTWTRCWLYLNHSLIDVSLDTVRTLWDSRDSEVLAFVMAAVIFVTSATFAVRPYYREHIGYGSPPLAIRTGLMAVGLSPIIVALSGKVTIVTMLIGIGHEKLNTIHRYVAWLH